MGELTIQQVLNLALQHHRAGRLAQAEQIYRQILAQQPNQPDALHRLGVLAAQAGRSAAAVDLIGRAAALRPDDPAIHSDLGSVLTSAGRCAQAIAACRRVIALKPDYALAHRNLGDALKTAGDMEQAVVALRRAVELDPSMTEAHSNLGAALAGLGCLDEAISACRRAIALNPQFAEPHSNLGLALLEQGEVDQAIAACQQAIVLKNDFPQAHANLGMALLLRGEFLHGWQEWEWRWQAHDFSSPARDFPQPQWDGQPLEGGTLLLHAEQGLGDTIQFVRYLPLVIQRAGPGRVALECQPGLMRLFSGLVDGGSTMLTAGGSTMLTAGSSTMLTAGSSTMLTAGSSTMLTAGCQLVARGQPLPAFDLHCPLLSLPRVFATTLENLPSQVPCLRPDAADVDVWRRRLANKAGHRGQGTGDSEGDPLYVGLVWAGNPGQRSDRRRSMSLACLAPLACMANVRFVSLQKGAAASQAQASPSLPLLDLTSDLRDMADTAALIANLDLVIGVCTSVVHLAGAMGKPVWTLLSCPADWRWLLGRDDSPWYPSMRLFRQPKSGDWDAVVADVAQALAAWAG